MLLNKIKADQLAARKAKDGLATALLTTLIGDAEMVGKNAGRLVTDEEVVAVIKKFIKNIDFGIASTKDVSNIDGSADYYVNQLKEKSILAHSYEDEYLSEDYGGPVRAFIPYLWGYKSAKSVVRIELMDYYVPGFWELRGYTDSAEIEAGACRDINDGGKVKQIPDGEVTGFIK